MRSITVEQLGINWGLLIAQLVNVGVVIWLLSILVYKPVLKMLNDRTERIQAGLQEAERMKAQMVDSRREYEAELAKARQEAAAILAQAQERARVQEAEIIAQAQERARQIEAESRERAVRERDQMLRDLKGQMAQLVAMTAEKVIGAELRGNHDRLIEESLAGLGRQN
jgi:F-type H+-transporting ATPase subunit b